MPYIKKECRHKLDKTIEQLSMNIDDLCNTHEMNPEGLINYAITKLFSLIYEIPSYAAYNNAIGVLECAKLELYRKVISEYEDQKADQNGIVWED